MPETLAYVTPRLIRWARGRYGLTPDKAAERIKTRSITAERLVDWENNRGHPTFPQAVRIAKKLHIPLGFLFLSEPPSLEVPIPDLRTVSGEPLSEPSPEFLDVLYDALRKQEWFRDYQQANEADPLPFIGTFSLATSPTALAADMGKYLRLDNQLRQSSYSWETFLRRLIRNAEAVGILVLRAGIVGMNTRRKLDVGEFRGFALSDDLAPLVFVNGEDAIGAQVFTLAHEMVHLWLGRSGISNPKTDAPPGDQPNAVERFSDKVAVELLVPRSDFDLRWRDSQDAQTNVAALAKFYRVSGVTVLRRALETERITREQFQQTYRDITAVGKSPKGDGGNSFYNLRVRNSTTLTRAIVSAVASGQVSEPEAASLLNVRVKTLIPLRDHLLETGALR